MVTYLNTFCNVRTKVLTYSQLHSLTQGFGLGPEYKAPLDLVKRDVFAFWEDIVRKGLA